MQRKIGALIYQQVGIRRNLYALRDKRFAAPFLDRVLQQAAAKWPTMLPWKWKPHTVLDVGAYQGKVAGQLARLYRPAFMALVEPQPHLAAELRRKTLAPRQEVFACALGRSDGVAVLNVLSHRSSSSLLQVSPQSAELFRVPMDVQRTLQVPVRTMDSVFAECRLQSLDLLKVDVQGFELEVFAGGIETLRRTFLVVTEVSFFEHYLGQPLFPDIYAFLIAVGFGLRGTFAYSYDNRGRPLQCDAVFVNLARI